MFLLACRIDLSESLRSGILIFSKSAYWPSAAILANFFHIVAVFHLITDLVS